MLMRVLLLLALCGLSACRSAEPGTCKKDSDCKDSVCVFGKCQECSSDTDCKDGKSCQNNQCVMADVPKTCTDSSDCGTGMSCQQGVCAVSIAADQAADCSSTGTVYFDFNVYELKPEGLDLLSGIASCMRSNPDQKFMVAGNTDERGTVEYNLALGEKRAKVVADYLQNSGIDGSRMNIISYGKEKPINPEHNEEAWSQNRRTDITLDH